MHVSWSGDGDVPGCLTAARKVARGSGGEVIALQGRIEASSKLRNTSCVKAVPETRAVEVSC